MNRTFIAARGCVYVPGGKTGKGFYALSPKLVGEKAAPIIITGTDAELGDILFPATTLDDEQFVYLMGKDVGSITVQGLALLGDSSMGGKAFDKVRRYFDKNRASKSKKPITLSLPGNSFIKFYLSRLVIGQADPVYHTQAFAFRGFIVEPKK